MRKKIIALAAAGILLTGCGTVQTSVSDGSEKIMTIGNKTYTKNDEYNLIKMVQGPTLALQGAQKMIYDKEVGTGDDIKKEAQEMYDQYAGAVAGFEDSLKQYGYKDKEDYMNSVVIPSIQAQKLLEKYMDEAKDTLRATYKPTVAAVIACSNEDNAKKALEALKNGENPAAVGSQYAAEGASYTGTEQVISTLNTDLPTRVINALNEATQPGILDEVFTTDTSTDNKTYYVAQLISQDYGANLKKITEALGKDKQINSDCVVFYLTKYKFEVHDQYVFDYFKATNPEYLVTRPDLAKSASSSSSAGTSK